MKCRYYSLQKLNGTYKIADWDKTSRAEIACIPWDKYSVYYPSYAQAIAYDNGLAVKLESREQNPVSTCTKLNEPVCNDSCLEFFFQPNTDDKQYFNFEFNPSGIMYLGIGTCRFDNRKLWPKDYKKLFFVKSFKHDKFWGVEFFIPLSFIRCHMPDFNSFPPKMRGNFYKCGDKTKKPHYICWNIIESDVPDFHRPECFGDIFCSF